MIYPVDTIADCFNLWCTETIESLKSESRYHFDERTPLFGEKVPEYIYQRERNDCIVFNT